MADDVRLRFASTLLEKARCADATTAERTANAASAILGPAVVRADDMKADDKGKDDANVKNQVLAGVADDKGAADAGPTLAGIMDAITKFSTHFGKRLDKLEGKGKDSEHTATPPNDKKAADDDKDDAFRWREKRDRLGTVVCSPDTQDAFAVIQPRADKVYGMNGQQADKPLHGETLIAYRRRLLLPMQKYSDTFKNSDLRVVAVDPAAFDAVESSIYNSAADAAFNPATVPLGHLRQHVEVRGGHTYTTFTGRPISWMAAFAPAGKRIKRINQHNNNGGPARVIFGSP